MKLLRFIIPSLIGILVFFVPFRINHFNSIFIIHTIFFIKENFIYQIYSVLTIFFILNFNTSLIASYFKKNEFFAGDYTKYFITNTLGLIIKLLAILIILSILYSIQVGPHEIHIINTLASPDTGQVVLSLTINLLLFIVVGNISLLLLSEFGLLEFLGTILNNLFAKMFKISHKLVPNVLNIMFGYNKESFDKIDKLYHSNNISLRTAYLIVFSFLTLELPLVLYLLVSLDLLNYSIQFITSILVINTLVALIIARLPIMNKYSNYSLQSSTNYKYNYNISNVKKNILKKCDDSFNNPYIIRRKVFIQIMSSTIHFLPFIIVFGTISIVLIKHPINTIFGEYYIFDYISYPINYILRFANIKDSYIASKAIIFGIFDFTIPSVIIYSSLYEKTKFLIALISCSQIIYITKYFVFFKNLNINFKKRDFVIFYFIRMFIILPLALLLINIIF